MVFIVSTLIVLRNCIWVEIGGDVYLDFWGYRLIFVTFWIVILSILRVHKLLFKGLYQGSRLYGLMSFLLLILILSFREVNYLGFYFYFEASIIPIFLIIIGYGYQPERLQAGLYFVYYTLGASLPLLVYINYYYRETGSLTLAIGLEINPKGFVIMHRLIITGAFLVKMPIFFIHL